MTRYQRTKLPGGTFFFTVVTYNRQKLLYLPDNVHLLRQAFRHVIQSHPFRIEAIVILPDHLHCLWTLPPEDSDFSTRWRLIKTYFSRHCQTGLHGEMSDSRQRKKEKAIWQRRFWEHTIRDELDFQRHVEYIHYNPVKHGLVNAPVDWEYSSFQRFVRAGIYSADWGSGEGVTFPDFVGQE